MLAIHGKDKRIQPSQSVPFYIASVQPECHFIDIAPQVLDADLMPRSENATLQERPYTFDAVCGDCASILFLTTTVGL